MMPHLHRLQQHLTMNQMPRFDVFLCMLLSQSLMVARAKDELEQEMVEKEEEKERYLEEKAPPIQTSGMSFVELQVQ